MIITQKYHSAREIDSEFIPGLESLLRDRVPSFNWLINFEKSCPETIHFHYYLFFGDKHNAPIGLAQVMISPLEIKKKFFHFLKRKNEGTKCAHWCTPGVNPTGIVFEPLYEKQGVLKALKLAESFLEREDIAQVKFQGGHQLNNLELASPWVSSKEVIISEFIKNCSSYEVYLERLDPENKKQVEHCWRELSKTFKLELGEYQQFKEIFQYKKFGKDQYKDLKSHAKVLPFLTETTNYITLENNFGIQAIVFLLHGRHGHSFFNWISLNEQISPMTFIQMAIMKFYENTNLSRLHFLGQGGQYQSFTYAGFTQIDLSVLDLKKGI